MNQRRGDADAEIERLDQDGETATAGIERERQHQGQTARQRWDNDSARSFFRKRATSGGGQADAQEGEAPSIREKETRGAGRLSVTLAETPKSTPRGTARFAASTIQRIASHI